MHLHPLKFLVFLLAERHVSLIDWAILSGFLAFTVWDGIRANIGDKSLQGYFLGNRSMPWWAVGLSIMATQASAITFISTTGLAFSEDIRFIQVYLAVPFAMAVLSVTLLPFYMNRKAYTAYETLEERFGKSTRLVTALLFLISRGLALSTIIAAPAYVLALILAKPLWIMILLIGLTATVYTMAGGVAGVIRTDVKQMAAILFGLVVCIVILFVRVSPFATISEGLQLADALGKTRTLDLTFDLSDKYNVWSGVIAGFFLMLSYFGCDQSQVQRYLTTSDRKQAARSLLVNAAAKVPMQFLVLMIGVWMFLFYVFHAQPSVFRTFSETSVASIVDSRAARHTFDSLHTERKLAATQYLEKGNAAEKQRFVESNSDFESYRKGLQKQASAVTGKDIDDTNYIFPFFVLHEMPPGVTGLIIAAIFAAALSSIDSTLNSLSAVSIIDWYKNLTGGRKNEEHYFRASKTATLIWGIFATCAALVLGETSSIIELVNKLGSYFYGSLLGIFVLMFLVPKAGSIAALSSLFIGMMTVFAADTMFIQTDGTVISSIFATPDPGAKQALAYLWLNPIGTASVLFSGWALSLVFKPSNRA